VLVLSASDSSTRSYVGQTGRLLEDDKTGRPFKVEFGDGNEWWFKEGELQKVGSKSVPQPSTVAGSRPRVGQSVRVVDGAYRKGQTGTLIEDDGSPNMPFKVRFSDSLILWLNLLDVEPVGPSGGGALTALEGGSLAGGAAASRRPTKNAVVRINARSERSGSLGVIIQDDHDEKPFKVRFADDVTKWYTESEVQWYGEAEVRARGTNVGDDLQALACLATVVGGVVHFVGVDTTLQVAGFVRDAAGSRGVGGAALRAAGGYFVMSPAADFVAEELAAAGFSLAAAAVLGIETGMILGPAGMVVGAAGAVAVEVVNEVAAAAGLGLLEALGVAESVGVGPVGLAASVVLCTIS
jgi:hypothetical protein